MPIPPGQAPAHLRSPHGAASVHLDALRGIAAVGVCLSHLRDFFFQDYSKLPHHNLLLAVTYLVTGLGHQWVTVFFVLSGYLIGGTVLRSVALDSWSWRSYLLNRMTRLYTVLIPALLLGGLLDLTGIHLFGNGGIYGARIGSHELTFVVSGRLTIPIMLGNYAFLQGIYMPTLGSNGPLWSLANEFWYYIAFPPLALALCRRVFPAIRLTSVVLLAGVVVFMQPRVAIMGLIWLMGVAIHYLPHLPAKNLFVRRILVVAAVAISAAALPWSKHTRSLGADYLLGLVITGLIWVVVSCSRTPMPMSYKRTAHILSRSSYTLYLVHVPLLVFIAAWTVRQRWVPDTRSVLAGCVIFTVTMLYAQVVWFFFERRTDEIRAWLKPRVMDIDSRAKSRETAARV